MCNGWWGYSWIKGAKRRRCKVFRSREAIIEMERKKKKKKKKTAPFWRGGSKVNIGRLWFWVAWRHQSRGGGTGSTCMHQHLRFLTDEGGDATWARFIGPFFGRGPLGFAVGWIWTYFLPIKLAGHVEQW